MSSEELVRPNEAATLHLSVPSFDVETIRADFPILERKINGNPVVYLDSAATSQKPHIVIDAISNYYRQINSNVHRGVHTLSMEATDAYETARSKIQRLIAAPTPESIIWTRNTSESLNLVAYSWALPNLKQGDLIVTTRMEHHSDIVPWQQVALRTGAHLKYIERTEEGRVDLESFQDLLDGPVRLVALSQVSNVLGTVLPVKKMARMAHEAGAVVVVDGAQSVPHMPVDVMDMGCDFLAFSAHKMLGPTGIGVLYGRTELLEEMPPWMFGGDMISEVNYESSTWNQLPYKFEAGTPNIAGAIATGVAVDYLMNLGLASIWEHDQVLTAYALERLQEIETIKVLGSLDTKDRGGVISFHHESIHPHDIGTALDKLGIAIRTGHHCAMPLVRSYGLPAAARASFYMYNTIAEVDMFIDGLKETEGYFSNAGIR